jgi:hypothetical protein
MCVSWLHAPAVWDWSLGACSDSVEKAQAHVMLVVMRAQMMVVPAVVRDFCTHTQAVVRHEQHV